MSATSDVTVIGLGPMGRAMTRSLLGNGYSVTVWNRTPSRAEGVVAAGARRASSAAAGLDTALPRAVQDHYRRVIEEDHGTEGWTRIIDSIRAPSAVR